MSEQPALTYGLRSVLATPFAQTLEAVKSALKDQGFGILSEIDLAATLKAKIGAEVEPQVILGACNPALAHRSLRAEPSIGLLLPCNVVVRAHHDKTIVEALDPQVMVRVTGNPALSEVADDAAARLRAALASLPQHV